MAPQTVRTMIWPLQVSILLGEKPSITQIQKHTQARRPEPETSREG